MRRTARASLAIGLLFATAACGPSFTVDGVPLEGTSWILVSVAGQPPVVLRPLRPGESLGHL